MSRNGAYGEGSARHPPCRETGGALPPSARGTAGRPGTVSNVGEGLWGEKATLRAARDEKSSWASRRVSV